MSLYCVYRVCCLSCCVAIQCDPLHSQRLLARLDVFSFLRPFLNAREKKIICLVLVLQVLDNIGKSGMFPMGLFGFVCILIATEIS